MTTDNVIGVGQWQIDW